MQVNRAADALGMSPLELRHRNVYRPGGVTPTQQVLGVDVAGVEVLERAAEASGSSAPGRRPPPRAPRVPPAPAPRVASASRSPGTAPGSPGRARRRWARSRASSSASDGRIRILTASTEMGQGTKTIFPQLVAAELELDIEDVEMAPQDTSFVPDSGPTVASRTAMVVGGLADLRRAPAQGRGRGPDGAPVRALVPRRRPGPRPHPHRRALRAVPGTPLRRRDVHRRRVSRRSAGRPPSRRSRSTSTPAEVAVLSVVAADDVGRVIHPVLCEGQVEGGTLQAVGYATIEEIKLLDGRYLNDRLATYLIPTALDAPRLETILVEAPFADAPHGAKGVGELPMDVGAPAVVAAIHDATGRLDPRPARDAGADPRRAGRRSSHPAAGRVGGVGPARRHGAEAPRDYDADGQRRAGRDRRAGHAPAARPAARGPRADRDQGGLRRGGVRRLHRAPRRRARAQLPRPGLPGRRARRPHRRGPRARGRRARACSSRRSSRPAAPSAASARRGCSWPARRSSPPAPSRPTRRSARPSPATSAAAPATRRSSTRSASRRERGAA